MKPSSASATHRGFWLAASLAILLLLAPVLVADRLPLLDVPSHAARLAVLHQLLVSGVGSPFYALDTLFLPNVGFDLVGLLLTAAVGPLLAGHLFFGASLAVTFTGVLALSYMLLGYRSVLPLASALLIYNLFVLLGFLSYGFGIALMFWALAARLWLERAGPLRRFLAGCAIGVVLLFCHLSAFATYAVVLAGIGLDQLLRQRRRFWLVALMGLELTPGVLLYLSMSTASQGRMHYDLPYWQTKVFGAAKSFSSGSVTADAAFVVGALSVALLVLLNRPRINWPLLPGVVLLSVLYFVLPQHVNGGSYVDVRIPAVVLLLLLVAVELRPRRAALVVPFALLAAGAFIVKQGALVASWAGSDRVLERVVRALDALPDGAVLLQASCVPEASDVRGVYANRQPPLDHVTAYAALEGRRFAAVSWTIKGQQTISTTPSHLPFKRVQSAMGASVCSMEGYRAVLRDARETLAASSASGGVAPPMYLVLSRPPQARMLESEAQLVAEPAPVEIYQVRQ